MLIIFMTFSVGDHKFLKPHQTCKHFLARISPHCLADPIHKCCNTFFNPMFLEFLRTRLQVRRAYFIPRIRGGEGVADNESSFADDDKALIQKLLRQQVVSAKTERKKEKRYLTQFSCKSLHGR